MQMIIPPKLSEYFRIQDDQVVFTIPENADSSFFTQYKDDLYQKWSAISDWSNLSQQDIKEAAREYALCNFALGAIAKEKAEQTITQKRLEAKTAVADALATILTIRSELDVKPLSLSSIQTLIDNVEQSLLQSTKATAQAEGVNDGLNRQHWIPECYMNPFTKNNEMLKVSKGSIRNAQKQGGSKKVGFKLNKKDLDFREEEANKGQTYGPEFELILSKFETDYSKLNKNADPINSFWDFIVLTTFFVIFYNRTKMKKISNSPVWNIQLHSLVDIVPSMVSELQVECFSPEKILGKGTEITFPFSQQPVHVDEDGDNSYSFWAVYSPTCLIWFKNNKSVVTNKHQFFLVDRLLGTIGNNDSSDLYFHPDTVPLWTGKLTKLSINKYGIEIITPSQRQEWEVAVEIVPTPVPLSEKEDRQAE